MLLCFLRKFSWLFALVGCTSYKPMWSYVVPKPVDKGMSRTPGTPIVLDPSQQKQVKVVYNDGSASTEVTIPVLESAQRIFIKHAKSQTTQSLALIADPPTKADKTLEDEYTTEARKINPESPNVSITKTLNKIRTLADSGNYELALQYAEALLARYPEHVQTLRAKGSLLLKMGERSAALKVYERAQEIEPNPQVEQQIQKLQKNGF